MFRSRIAPLNFRPGTTGSISDVAYAPVLHARWTSNASGGTPMPFQRPSTPASVGPEGSLDFTLDDENFSHADYEMAVSVRDPNWPSWGPLFRSGPVRDLPASMPENPNGFIQIVFVSSEQTITTVNESLAAKFAAGPRATTDPAVAITGASMAANSNNPATWLITVFGTYNGSIPLTSLATLFFRYSGEFSLTPFEDPFAPARLITTNLGGTAIVFSDAPGGGPLAGLLDSSVTFVLNLISPIAASFVQEQVRATLDEEIANDVRGRVAEALGVPRNSDGTPGPLRPNVRISLQESKISAETMTILATVGSFGPVVATPSGSGCSLGMLLTLAMVALGLWLAG